MRVSTISAFAPTSPAVAVLQSTIRTIDTISQSGLSEIYAMADMALKLMETEHAYIHPETIAQALESIRARAMSTEDEIFSEAQEAGCEYRDKSSERREEARLSAELLRKEAGRA